MVERSAHEKGGLVRGRLARVLNLPARASRMAGASRCAAILGRSGTCTVRHDKRCARSSRTKPVLITEPGSAHKLRRQHCMATVPRVEGMKRARRVLEGRLVATPGRSIMAWQWRSRHGLCTESSRASTDRGSNSYKVAIVSKLSAEQSAQLAVAPRVRFDSDGRRKRTALRTRFITLRGVHRVA